MNFQQIRQKTDQLRAVPLPAVLEVWGAKLDPHDKHKWHTSQGTLSLNGPKFINWNRGEGGGGAIDLIIHLNHCNFSQALQWLQCHFPQHPIDDAAQRPPAHSSLRLPPSDPHQLQRVKSYLTTQRAIPLALIDPLIAAGTLYADHKANAMFLLRDSQGCAVGAELRGTTSRQWRGMAPGSRKNLGFFSVCAHGACPNQPVILCESAIDAISALALLPGHRCISTSGARPNPIWLTPLIKQHHPVYCGFDADDTGEAMARAMIGFHPSIKRLRPPCRDWNQLLASTP